LAEIKYKTLRDVMFNFSAACLAVRYIFASILTLYHKVNSSVNSQFVERKLVLSS
jgi:hypothetical protein